MSDERMTLKDFAEQALDPIRNEYVSRKYDQFIKQTKDVACPGCNETALFEYVIVNPERGILLCPRCGQTVDLKTMMAAWLTFNPEELMS